MLEDILGIIVRSASDSFLQVTVFVGAALLLFAYIDYRKQGKLVQSIEDSKAFQPVIGALLGLTPGCGGAIFIMPLFIRGSVSYGTVIATLIATAGDSAFITMTQTPSAFLKISAFSFLAAVATGYLVDFFKVGEQLRKSVSLVPAKDMEKKHNQAERVIDRLESSCRSCPPGEIGRSNRLNHVGHDEGDAVDLALHHKNPLNRGSFGYRLTHKGYHLFWLLSAIGLVLGVMALAQVDVYNLPVVPKLGMMIGMAGTVTCLSLLFLTRKFLKGNSHEEQEHKLGSLRETLIHSGMDTAFVGSWVFVAYAVYEVAVFLLGGEAVVSGWILAAGVSTVLVGALLGIIPGCGPQIIFVTLFAQGVFPFSALLANAISQDGDALFPLLAMNKKSAIHASIITTLPALAVGGIAYYIEGLV